MAKRLNTVLAYIFGVIFIVLLLTIALFVPNPTEAQWYIFKTIIALAAAGVATVLSGSLTVEIPKVLKGAGALGIFAVVFFYNPANLVVKQDPTDPELKTKSAYSLKSSVWVVDLTQRQPTGSHDLSTKFSEVVVDRQDKILKVGKKKEPFTLFSGTSGLAVEWEPIASPARAEFKSNISSFNPLPKSYNYLLHIEDLEPNQIVTAVNRFTFWNAFQGEDGEWWAVDVPYPTEKAVMTIIFPASKPCRSVDVYERQGDAPERKIEDNPPQITKGGRMVYWSASGLQEKNKYIFKWKW